TLALLLEFSRAWLPATLREHCIVRVYVRDPEPLLGFGTNLLAIPRDTVTHLMTLRPGAVVLDSAAERIDGQPAATSAIAYAHSAFECFAHSEDIGVEWLSRISYLIPEPELPDG